MTVLKIVILVGFSYQNRGNKRLKNDIFLQNHVKLHRFISKKEVLLADSNLTYP